MIIEDLKRGGISVDKNAHVSFLHSIKNSVPLILLPGSYSDALQFKGLLKHLPDECSVVIVEARGHGQSWPPVKKGSINLFARDVVAVANELGLEKFHVGGHSIGGMIAIEVARICPEKVAGVVSIEGWTNHRAAKDAYKGIDMNCTLSKEQLEYKRRNRERVLKNWTKKQVKHFGTRWRKWDGLPFLSESTIPILEIYGDRGSGAADQDLLQIPRRENIQFVVIENGSHSLPLQYPEKLAHLIIDFLRDSSND
ncbi:MAG: alpha/beta fold hydrolase [Candidatus Hodarchaeota archaeon]